MKDNKKISRQAFIKNFTVAAGGMLLPAAGWSFMPKTDLLPGFVSLVDPTRSRDATALSPGILAQDTWRGSWIQYNNPAEGDLLLAANGQGCQLVVSRQASSAVQQAARFLAADIQKISGYLPPIVSEPSTDRICIRMITMGTDAPPAHIAVDGWASQPEAYRIVTDEHNVWLTGADFRGTAFAAYTLSERLGIDPLYWWTGYEPERHPNLRLKKTDFHAASPAFRYRGFFHDDEDILQRPFEASGYPLRFGDIPLEWYQRFFETALRLRMNMVAPYTRAHRRKEVQQCASDWGLFYTSHHYDILLSNPFGIERFNLAEKRRVNPVWDWFTNRKGMTGYWKGGVEENKDLYSIWPVGLRGTDDHAYAFPPGTTASAQAKTFREVVDTQVQLVEQALPEGHRPLFHFTLYTEMLEQYLHNREAFNVPENVIIVWPDNNNGIMRDLPADKGKWKHGVYYHLAYFGGTESKQSFHTVSPQSIAEQFGKIIDAGATEFMLVNTTELREFVMEARMIARLTWEGKSMYAAGGPAGPSRAGHAADEYIRWWSREYFGKEEEPVTALYHRYYDLFNKTQETWFGTDRVQEMLDKLSKKFNRLPYDLTTASTVSEWTGKLARYNGAVTMAEETAVKLDRPAQQFLFEQLTLWLHCNAYTLRSALLLNQALTATGDKATWDLIGQAVHPLQQLELALLRAERPPFEKWYRETWIKTEQSPLNLHRPYQQLRAFIAVNGKISPIQPPVKMGHNIPQAQRWTRFLESTDNPDQSQQP